MHSTRSLLALGSLVGLASLGLTACAPTPVTFECLDDDPLCSLAENLETLPPAVSVDIQAIALYQTAEKVLMEDGEAVDDGLSVAEGRDALLRVFLSPADTYEERDLAVRALIYQGEDLVDAVMVKGGFGGAGDWDDLGSTFNLEIPGRSIGTDFGLVVEVLESEAGASYPGIQGLNTWPEEGWAAVETTRTGPLRILMVPIQYDADGSGRLPNTSDEEMDRFAADFYAHYPATEVEIEVTEPYSTANGIRNGGFSGLLNEVTAQRDALGADPDQYVYGIFDPGSDPTGGTAGLCWVGGVMVCIGLTGQTGTAIHEVGHAHGRLHSPGCGAGDPDPAYPESDGTLGTRAYNSYLGTLYGSTEAYDFMSYCGPTFTSAHTWESLVTRVKGINDTLASYGQESIEWQMLFVDAAGNSELGGRSWYAQAPAGQAVHVLLLDADGVVLSRADAVLNEQDHALGSMLRVPAWVDLDGVERVQVVSLQQ